MRNWWWSIFSRIRRNPIWLDKRVYVNGKVYAHNNDWVYGIKVEELGELALLAVRGELETLLTADGRVVLVRPPVNAIETWGGNAVYGCVVWEVGRVERME